MHDRAYLCTYGRYFLQFNYNVRQQKERYSEMKKLMEPFIVFTIFLIFSHSPCFSQSHEYQFIKTYIGNLGRQYKIEITAKSEIEEAGQENDKLIMTNMRNAKRSILELRADINSLLAYKESKNDLIKSVSDYTIESYQQLIQNYSELVEQNELMINALSGSNPNVDIGKMMSKATDISSRHEFIMGTLSKSSQLLAFSILDTIPDVNGKLTYLLVTSQERKDLLSELDSIFGKSIKSIPKGQTLSTNISIAYILRVQLSGNKKSKDEREK
jgi:hypothetical protein